MKRVAAVVLIIAALGAGLTGCGRFNQDARPSPVASTPAPDAETPTSSESLDDLLAELDSVDTLVTESEQDATAGDEAARADDAP